MDKEVLVDMIINTALEKLPGFKDVWEKHIYLENKKVLIVGFREEDKFNKEDPGEEVIRSYYWYWELRDTVTWEILDENQEKDFVFCESDMGGWSDQDRVEDIVGDISEAEVCTWSDQDFIEDIAHDIADEVLGWL
ncbi:MAG: hypothetical protein FJ150_01430 [Euryarchaeota archaeon]|nr:hypothetical protein [Euryarchaeota archaeon]